MSDDKIVDLQGKPVDPKSVPSNQGDTMNKGIYTDEQMAELYPPFKIYTGQNYSTEFTQHVAVLNGDFIFVYFCHKESWLKHKLSLIIRDWCLIEYI